LPTAAASSCPVFFDVRAHEYRGEKSHPAFCGIASKFRAKCLELGFFPLVSYHRPSTGNVTTSLPEI